MINHLIRAFFWFVCSQPFDRSIPREGMIRPACKDKIAFAGGYVAIASSRYFFWLTLHRECTLNFKTANVLHLSMSVYSLLGTPDGCDFFLND